VTECPSTAGLALLMERAAVSKTRSGYGMRFRLTASVYLKSPYNVAEPLLKPLVLWRMRRAVIEPLKRGAEDERGRSKVS
jgi:hypothetical protein